ncbi:MAG: hypothetical protein M3P96_05730 [Actinomycetota bacterium]|nr:hypothetical protein [Actinomycetota bacterium]
MSEDRPRMAGREVDYVIFVSCSDRGQHKPMLLCTAYRKTNGDCGMNMALKYFAPPAEWYPGRDHGIEPPEHTPRHAYTFWCPRCPRTPQIHRDRWWRALDTAADAGLTEIDVSLLS